MAFDLQAFPVVAIVLLPAVNRPIEAQSIEPPTIQTSQGDTKAE